MAKARVLFKGNTKNHQGVVQLKKTLAELGSKYLILVETEGKQNMEVDVSDLEYGTNILEEAKYIIETAKKISIYEKRRKRIIRQIRTKALLATTRKNIN